MGCPGEGPCTSWELDLSCCLVSGGFPDPCLGDGTSVDQSIIDAMTLAASQFMWAATGRQFGCCTVNLRPTCNSQCPCDGPLIDSGFGFPWTPRLLDSGEWTNVTCGNPCNCVEMCTVPLPYPVCSVDEVVIDGVILDDTEYTVTNFNKLIRKRSDGCWPKCNDLSLSDTELGTWRITVTYGKPVPQLVLLAANEFACQLIKKCVGRPCDLPQRIQSVNRQGMSATFLDPMEFMREGLTGIFLVDLAIKTYNPHRLMRKPIVASPDSINKWAVTTWQSGDPIGSCASSPLTEFSLITESDDPITTESNDLIITEDG